MKLTTKRNRWYFFRELFSYMIPMILIAGTIDVFYHFMQCPLHPERSAPCSVNRILATIYWIFLLIIIILATISAKKLNDIKEKIENEFLETINKNQENEFKQTNNPKEKKKDVRIIDKKQITKKSKERI